MKNLYAIVTICQDQEKIECIKTFNTEEEANNFIKEKKEEQKNIFLKREKYIDDFVDSMDLDYIDKMDHREFNIFKEKIFFGFYFLISKLNFKASLKERLKTFDVNRKELGIVDFNPPSLSIENYYIVKII